MRIIIISKVLVLLMEQDTAQATPPGVRNMRSFTVNSFFKVYGTNISEVDFELKIYNRWGEQIISLHHPDEVWLGNHRDNANYFVPDGVYNWQLHLRDKFSLQRYEASGHVVIFR